MRLSYTQNALVSKLKETGGLIEWRKGGFWTAPGVASTMKAGMEVPEWYFDTNTVKALLKRGVLVEAGRHEQHGFINAARLTDAT